MEKTLPESTQRAKELWTRARACIESRQLEEALALLGQSLEAGQTAEANHYKGVVHYLSGQRDKAVDSFLAAISIDAAFDKSLSNLAVIALESGDRTSALQYIAMAVKAAPDNDMYKNNMASIIGQTSILMFNPEFKRLIGICLESPAVDHNQFFVPWFSLLKCDPDLRPFYKLARHTKYKAFKKDFFKLKQPEAILDPYFLTGIKRMIVSDMDFERLMTHTRRLLLDYAAGEDEARAMLDKPQWDGLYNALAQYCFHTEYIFEYTAGEAAQVAALRAKLEAMAPDGLAGNLRLAMVLGCYMPLADLRNAPALAKALQDAAPDLARIQITDPLEERQIAGTIETLTPIANETSLQVRAQYEVFPYPRWKSISSSLSFRGILGDMKDRDLQILVAGCGTGREAMQAATAFPKADILAIDLSLASLSYAIRQTRSLGAANITFRQADILELGRLNRTFDIISSTGVLHHLKNPVDGWRVLAGMVRPGGYMRIALYSRIARRAFIEAQELIVHKGFGTDAGEIRRFRREAPRLLKASQLKKIDIIRDYYSMSECRDFLFHVMENRFVLPEIEALLPELGLEFVRFNAQDWQREAYRKAFPDDPQENNLKNWAQLEGKIPDLFVTTYDFWCRKI